MTKNYFALPLAFVAALALVRTAPVTAQGLGWRLDKLVGQ